MTHDNPRDKSVSIKAKLLNHARETKEEFNLILIRYGIERLLYRLSCSEHANTFVVKGAILFQLYADVPHRPTRDIDLHGKGASDVQHLENVIQNIVSIEDPDDGLVFDKTTILIEKIKEGQQYEGIRATLTAFLGKARIPLQMDIGFGDAITPKPQKREIPCILDLKPPHLAVYPWETVVAEKFQALVDLGMTNSRMKDFYDLQIMANTMSFNGVVLAEAIRCTFDRRETEIPVEEPIALTKTFYEDDAIQKRWRAFVRRQKLGDLVLSNITNDIWAFLGPVVSALNSSRSLNRIWDAGGPWK